MRERQFSIVVPTCRRDKLLGVLIKGLCRLDYPRDRFEIIVVDNAGVINTKTIIQKYKNTHKDLDISYVIEKQEGPSFARNKGLLFARFKYVLFLDDDTQVENNLLIMLNRSFDEHAKVAIVGGKMIAYSREKSLLQRYLRLLGSDSWIIAHTQKKSSVPQLLSYPICLPSGVMAVNRGVWRDVCFNTSLGIKKHGYVLYSEDTALCLEAYAKHMTLLYDPRIVVHHAVDHGRLSLYFIAKRYLLYGVERRILDKIFRSQSFYSSYVTNYKNVLRSIIKFQRFDLCSPISLLRNIFTPIGYFVVSKYF